MALTPALVVGALIGVVSAATYLFVLPLKAGCATVV